MSAQFIWRDLGTPQPAVKSGLGDNFGQSDTKSHYFTSLFVQTPLRHSVTMAITKVPGDQNLFERVCYMFIRKVTKFQLSMPIGFRVV